jgi:hypothetical protein
MLRSVRVAFLRVILLIKCDPTAFREVGLTLLRRNSFEVRGSNAFEKREYKYIVGSRPKKLLLGL